MVNGEREEEYVCERERKKSECSRESECHFVGLEKKTNKQKVQNIKQTKRMITFCEWCSFSMFTLCQMQQIPIKNYGIKADVDF